jgi:hypothetical protein
MAQWPENIAKVIIKEVIFGIAKTCISTEHSKQPVPGFIAAQQQAKTHAGDTPKSARTAPFGAYK